jgi:hypothetical protein
MASMLSVEKPQLRCLRGSVGSDGIVGKSSTSKPLQSAGSIRVVTIGDFF